MNVIAIETSGLNGSVALLKNDVILKEGRLKRGMVHGKLLLPSLQRALKETRWSLKKINLVAVDIGPGSYTGLRVGLAAAKTLAYALKTKLIGVSSLDAMTENIVPKYDYIVPVIDARWQQIYSAVYQRSNNPLVNSKGTDKLDKIFIWQRITDYLSLEPAKLLKILPELVRRRGENVLLFGNALVKYKNVFNRPGIIFAPQNRWIPRAGKIGQLGYHYFKSGRRDNPFKLIPLYLK
ncbi:MAG: tRNA (adenosine(37)-N6)-threonylcarbamoyltransferase complex dimerization subunit type 1 TsaB [Planctomycetota bacterium]